MGSHPWTKRARKKRWSKSFEISTCSTRWRLPTMILHPLRGSHGSVQPISSERCLNPTIYAIWWGDIPSRALNRCWLNSGQDIALSIRSMVCFHWLTRESKTLPGVSPYSSTEMRAPPIVRTAFWWSQYRALSDMDQAYPAKMWSGSTVERIKGYPSISWKRECNQGFCRWFVRRRDLIKENMFFVSPCFAHLNLQNLFSYDAMDLL